MTELLARCILVVLLVIVPTTAARGADDGRSQRGYDVTNLPSLGGSFSAGSSINDRGWIAGPSNLAGDDVRHATLWRHDSILDLGALGGPQASSSVAWPVKNVRGLITGISQTDTIDPLGEQWSCSFFLPSSNRTCLGFAWERGRMRALPTFGGNNGFATGSNNRRQIVGWAESTVRDPTCEPPQVLQFRAALWGPGENQIAQLPPLAGDTVSAATAINDRGHVVGISGICDQAIGRLSAIHAVLWKHGTVTDIGNLGGVAWNTPMAINQRGDVVGFANASAADGSAFNARAFLWTRRHGIRPLPMLPGDATSQALAINNRRQVVGLSCTTGFASCRAFVWDDGRMTDLNTLVAPGYADHLYAANDINERGQITGEAIEQTTGASVAYAASPDRERGPHRRDAARAGRDAAVALPGVVRRALMAQTGVREADLSGRR